MANDNTFKITIKDFHLGRSPLGHENTLSEYGVSGQHTFGRYLDLLGAPQRLRAGPALTTQTNGTQAGAVTELINYILDIPPVASATYGIGNTKLFKLTSSAVTNDATWPHAITSATGGKSVVEFQGSLYYFFNKASGGDIGKYDLSATFDDDWGTTVPTGAAAIQSAEHPVAKKQDILVFGNGRYLGTYISTTNTLDVDKLDFGPMSRVVDVIFHANQWWIAVNTGSTTSGDRISSQIYLWDGAALSAILSDEIGLGNVEIGFLLVDNGVVKVAYRDLSSSTGFAIGYISGRQLKPLRYFSRGLPTYAQKTLYANTVLFVTLDQIQSLGAAVEQLPVQIHIHADVGLDVGGALAAPFGTPMIASRNNASTAFQLARFGSSFNTDATWQSLTYRVVNGDKVGMIDKVVVLTNDLGAAGELTISMQADQETVFSPEFSITGNNKVRHVITNTGLPPVSDFYIHVAWAENDSATLAMVRQIDILGHWVEKA